MVGFTWNTEPLLMNGKFMKQATKESFLTYPQNQHLDTPEMLSLLFIITPAPFFLIRPH